MPYQLRPDQTLDAIVDRITDAAVAATSLGRARVHEVADLVLRTRVVQSVSCGRTDDCDEVVGHPWPSETRLADEAARPCRLEEPDLEALPRMFAVAVADLTRAAPARRAAVESTLAESFRAVLAPMLVETRLCGHGSGCRSPATDPFVPSQAPGETPTPVGLGDGHMSEGKRGG